MMKTRITRISKRTLAMVLGVLMLVTSIGLGSIITVIARNGSTMYVCVSDATMASNDANEVWVNVKQNENSNQNNWTSAEMESSNKFYNGKRIYKIVGVEDTTWGGLGALQIQLKKDGTWKAQKEPKANNGSWWSSSNYANKLYNYDSGSFVGTYSDASYANGFSTGDYYIHNNVTGAWYGNGVDAPKMTKSGGNYYYDFYLKKNEVDTSNYLIFKFWDASDELQIGPDYESDHRCTLSTSDSWSSTVQSIQNYGDKDTAWQVNTSGFTTDKFNRVRITFDPTTLANSRNGRVKFTKTELADMDPTFSTTSFTKGTSYNLTSLVGVTSGSNAGTVSYSTYQYYDTSWHTISSPASWTPSATNITKLRVTATDGGVITTAGTTKNAVTARTETKETAITVSLATHTVSRSSAPSNGTLQLSSDNSTWGTSALTVAEGSNYYVKATPNTGYKINTLTVAGSTITDANNSTSAYTHTGTMGTSNVTASCTFSPQVYTITYKDQGDAAFSGTHASGYPTTHTYGTATTLKSASKTGYTFGGWYTSDDCSGSAVTSLGATAYTSNITLYAKWTLKSYNITLSESGTTGGTLKVDGSVASTATHGSHTFRVDAPAGYEISSISSTGATWTNNESYATSGSVSVTGAYTISVTYIKSAKPALRIDYTGSAGTTYTATNGDSVTTSTRHDVTVTFTNQSSFDNGTSYTVTQKIGSNAATTISSGTTSSSGGNIVAKAAGTLSAGTYLYTVTVGSKSTAITVVVNQSYSLAIPSVSGATLSASFTDEFGNAQLKTAADTYYAKSGTSYTVTYTADSDYCFSSSSNSTTTSSVSSTVSSNTSVTAPTIYEKKFTLTKNTYKTNADSTTSSSNATTTLTTVTGTDVASGQQAGYYVTSWQVTSGTVYVNGTAYTSSSGAQSIAASSTSYTLSSVTIKAAATVRFNFTERSYTLTKKKKVGDAAAANIGTQACYRVTKSTVTAPAITGYKVTSWQITTTSNYFYIGSTLYNSASGVQDIDDVDTYTLSNVTIRGNTTIQFNYVENIYAVTVASATQGTKALGTVSPSSVSAGIDTKPTITATAKTGYEFTGWTGSNVTFTNANNSSTTVSASAAGTATANFRQTKLYLDISANSTWKGGDDITIYFFSNGSAYTSDSNYPNGFVTMTAVDGVENLYVGNIPSGFYDNKTGNWGFIFRYGNWTKQTADLQFDANKNKYTLLNTESNNKTNYTLAADAYFPPITYDVIVNAGANGTVDGTTTKTIKVPDEGTAYTLPTPQASYGYKFTGWELISGSIVYNNTTYSTANTVFSTTASTAIIANQASTVRANFDYDDNMNLRIGGRFRAKNGSGNYIYTNGASEGSWKGEGTAGYMEFSYNSTGHYYYYNTNDTLADVSAYTYNNEGAYFRVYDAGNSKSWTPPSNVTFDDSNEGADHKYGVNEGGSENFIFGSTSTNGPVTICFDPIARKVWYTIPARHTVSVGTISRTVRTTTTSDTNGGTVTVNSGASATVSEGTNYTIAVNPVAGYKLTALAVNGTSIITKTGTGAYDYTNATSEFTISRAMGEGDSNYAETITATFTAIQYSVTVGKNSSNSSNTVKFKINGVSTQYTEKTDVTVADTITPVVVANTSNGYECYRIRLTTPSSTSAISGYSNLTNNSAISMLNQNVRFYVIYRAALPTITASNKSVIAGQPITIGGTTESWASFTNYLLKTTEGTELDSQSSDGVLTAPTTDIDRVNGTDFKVTLTSTNDKSSDISSSSYNKRSATKTVTVHVSYSATQLKYLELSDQYSIYDGYGITEADIESGWSAYNTAKTNANNALSGLPAWNATNTSYYRGLLEALETAYSNLVFKTNTIYVLSKYEHSASSYVNIFVFNNDDTVNHNPSPIFYTDTSLTTINNTARNYHMTYEGETNDHKHLYSFTYRGHQEFIIYRCSSETNTLTDGAKLTGDVDLRNTTNYPYGEYYIDVKNTDVTSSPSVTSASTFTDFSISATGADSDLMVGQCKEGATGYTVSQIQSWLGITFNGSLASTSSQTVAQTYTITGPVGRGVPTEATVDSDHNWVPLKPGRYTVSLNASLGTDERASAGATFTGSKSTVGDTQTVLDLFVAFDDIEIYADMNGNVGTPTIHFTYTDNQEQDADLPYEFDMVTGSESIYSYTISVSTLKDVYHIDLLNGAHTEGGITYRAAQVSKISIDSVDIENSSFSIARDAARTGTLWLKADSSNMKTFNKIAYGSSTRTFKAVLREDGEDDVDFNNSFAEVSGTGIITDELIGDSYQYNSFYAAKDTNANYDFSYNVKAKADHDISQTVGNTTTHYYFDHWESITGSTTNTAPSEANGADINILTAPDYNTSADVTYVAVYKPVSTSARVEITYNFEDFDTSDGNYEYDSTKTLKDASYTKTVKLGTGALISYTSANSSNAAAIAKAVAPSIESNYFDYNFTNCTATYNSSSGYDSTTNKYTISANVPHSPHSYKVVVKYGTNNASTRVVNGYYQQAETLQASTYGITSGNYYWCIMEGDTERVLAANQNYIARFVTSNSVDNSVQTIYLKSGTASASTTPNSAIMYSYSITYYDDDTQKAQHNFYIIDALTSSNGTLVGGGVIYATATNTTANSGTYRQTSAATHLASDNSRTAYINGILNGTYDKEYKAQTIDNVGFRYLPYSKGADVFRYSDDIKAYIYTFSGTNTNSSSLGTQTLRVFSYFVYEKNGSYTTVVSSTYAECTRYVS